MPGPASTSQSAFLVVVHLPKRQADEQSTISAATSASTSTVTPSTSRPATALGPAPKRKPKRPKKSRAPKESGSGSDSDNYSVVACVDDEAAGTSKAKRIAVLAKADPRTQPDNSHAGPSRATPTLPSKGTVSKRALSRARSEVRTESSSRTDSPSEQATTAPSSSTSNTTPSSSASASPALPRATVDTVTAAPRPASPVVIRVSAISIVAPEDDREVCRDYATYGMCAWGSKCALRHLPPTGAGLSATSTEQRPPDPNEKKLCLNFWNYGRCQGRRTCSRRHVYKRELPELSSVPLPVKEELISHQQNPSAVSAPVRSETPVTAPTISALPSTKVGPPPSAAPTTQTQSTSKSASNGSNDDNREVCRRFMAGKCRNRQCPRLHPSPQATEDTPPPSTPSTTAVNVNQTVKQIASKQPAALTREQKGKGPESTVPVPPPTPTATAQKATQQQKGKPSQPSSPPTPVATAQKATWEQKGKAPEFTPPAPPSAPPAAAQKPQEEKAAPEEKLPTRQQKVVHWLEHRLPEVPAPKNRSQPLSRESSLASTSTLTSDSDWSAPIRTAEEEEYGWATSSESDGPETPPHSAFGASPHRQASMARREQGDRPICRIWAQGGHCKYGAACKFEHVQEVRQPSEGQICMAWLQGYCPHGHNCDRRHVWGVVTPRRPVFPKMSADSATTLMTITVFDYICVVFGPGFGIEKISTAFDSGSVLVQNVPPSIEISRIANKLGFFGKVGQIHRKETDMGTYSTNVVADFASQHEATNAVAGLNGVTLWGAVLAARLLVTAKTNGLISRKDASVRISWEAPGKVGYAGFDTRGEAEAVVQRLDGTIQGECVVEAAVYQGLPALNRVNARFWVPATMTLESFRTLVGAREVMLDHANYTSLKNAENMIHCMAGNHGSLVSFRMTPPVHRSRMVRAWAEYATPAAAEIAATSLHGFRNRPLGKRAVWAHQVMSLEYSLYPREFDTLRTDLLAMQESCGKGMDLPTLQIIQRPSNMVIRLQAQNMTTLARLKAEYESIRHGEDIKENGETVWDEYFKCSSGQMFLYGVEQSHPGIQIKVDQIRRKLTVLGPSTSRTAAAAEVLAFVGRLRSEQTYAIPLTGNPVGFLMSKELMDLQMQFGTANVVLNLAKRVLAIRGSASAVETARVAILHAGQNYPNRSSRPQVAFKECPACNNEVNAPVHLPCRHEWCQTCLAKYLSASTDNSLFPLACFGGDGACTEPIPLSIARRLVSADQFEAVAHAAFRAHVHARPHEFRHCPTADCAQVYRPVPEDAVLSCPSCLVRICGRCGEEQHEGTPCTSRAADAQFEEWKNTHDVKACPGCNVHIEKAEGCNHLTCTRCRTHICWSCLKTFPQGDGIYTHMREEHGGIGLVA